MAVSTPSLSSYTLPPLLTRCMPAVGWHRPIQIPEARAPKSPSSDPVTISISEMTPPKAGSFRDRDVLLEKPGVSSRAVIVTTRADDTTEHDGQTYMAVMQSDSPPHAETPLDSSTPAPADNSVPLSRSILTHELRRMQESQADSVTPATTVSPTTDSSSLQTPLVEAEKEKPQEPSAPAAPRTGIIAGMVLVWHDKLLMRVIMVYSLINFFNGAVLLLVPLLCDLEVFTSKTVAGVEIRKPANGFGTLCICSSTFTLSFCVVTHTCICVHQA